MLKVLHIEFYYVLRCIGKSLAIERLQYTCKYLMTAEKKLFITFNFSIKFYIDLIKNRSFDPLP